MAEVSLHVYDFKSRTASNAIVKLNRFMRDGIRVGGIFHGAIEVYDEEWSFGYWPENETGVFNCPPKGNPSYIFRETVALGQTTCSRLVVEEILVELSEIWRGNDYNVLSRNCNHFCEVFAARLGVEKLPPWLNCLPKAGDSVVEVAGFTMEKLKQAKAKTREAAVEVAGLTVEKLKQAKAKTGDAAIKVAGLTVEKLKQAKAGVNTAGRNFNRYLFGDRPTSYSAGSDAGSQGSQSVSGNQGEML